MSKGLVVILLLFLVASFPVVGQCSNGSDIGRLPLNSDKDNYSYIGRVSAYNTGDKSQTDDSPCIGASMIDLCSLADKDIMFFAINNVPMFSWACVEGVGCGYVLDRMNSRYSNGEVDVGLSLNKKLLAKKFGVKYSKITIYER